MKAAPRLVEIYRLREAGKAEEAIEAVREKLVTITARDGEMWRQLMHLGGQCLIDLGRYSEGERCFSEVWETIKDPMALAERGCARWLQGNAVDALDDYLTALPLYPAAENTEIALRQIAMLSLELGDPLDALKYLNECERRYGASRKSRRLRQRIENYCDS